MLVILELTFDRIENITVGYSKLTGLEGGSFKLLPTKKN